MKALWIFIIIAPVLGISSEIEDFFTSAPEIALFSEEKAPHTKISYYDLELEDEESNSYPLLDIQDDEDIDEFGQNSTSRDRIQQNEQLYREIEKNSETKEGYTPSYEERGPLFNKPKVTQLPPEPLKEEPIVVAPKKELKQPKQEPVVSEKRSQTFSRKGRRAPIAQINKSPVSQGKNVQNSQTLQREPMKSEKKVYARPKAIAKQNRQMEIKKRALRASSK